MFAIIKLFLNEKNDIYSYQILGSVKSIDEFDTYMKSTLDNFNAIRISTNKEVKYVVNFTNSKAEYVCVELLKLI